ncbi:MAG: hypothetical protein U0610_05225 [bacterium]
MADPTLSPDWRSRVPRHRDVYWIVPLVAAALAACLPSWLGEIREAPLGTWRTAYYPSGIYWLDRALHGLGFRDTVVLGKAILLALGLGALALAARRSLGPGWAAWWVMMAAALHPRLCYDAMSYRDTAGELAGLGGGLLALTYLAFPRPASSRTAEWLAGAGAWLAFTLGALVRVTTLTTALVVVAGAIVCVRAATKRRVLAVLLAALGVSALGLCARNARVVGAFRLSTNLGYILYMGNHPLYLRAHPQYDVDEFFEREFLPVVLAERRRDAGEAVDDETASDRWFSQEAIAMIERAPAAFVYRLVLKSYWYWFGIEHLPALGDGGHLSADGRAVIIDATDSPRRMWVRLPYVLYRLAFVPATIGLAWALARRRIPREWALFALPLVGLWPPSVLTFPDTRYHLVAEPWLVIAAVAWLRQVLVGDVDRGRGAIS